MKTILVVTGSREPLADALVVQRRRSRPNTPGLFIANVEDAATIAGVLTAPPRGGGPGAGTRRRSGGTGGCDTTLRRHLRLRLPLRAAHPRPPRRLPVGGRGNAHGPHAGVLAEGLRQCRMAALRSRTRATGSARRTRSDRGGASLIPLDTFLRRPRARSRIATRSHRNWTTWRSVSRSQAGSTRREDGIPFARVVGAGEAEKVHVRKGHEF